MSSSPMLLSESLRVLLSLIAVIGLIYFLMHILSKLSSGKKNLGSGNQRLFEVVARLNLSPKKAIYLVRIGEKVLVVGVNGGIYLLTTIEDEETVKSFQTESGNPGSGKFSQILKNLLSFRQGRMGGLFFSGKIRGD